MIVSVAFIHVRARQSVSVKATVAGTPVRPYGVDAECVETAHVPRTLVDVHAPLPVGFVAAAARAAEGAGQVYTACVAKCGGTHRRSL